MFHCVSHRLRQDLVPGAEDSQEQRATPSEPAARCRLPTVTSRPSHPGPGPLFHRAGILRAIITVLLVCVKLGKKKVES